MSSPDSVPLPHDRISLKESRQYLHTLLESAQRRRSVRDFSSEPVPRDIIDGCLNIADTAPNGANQQPWNFVAVQAPAIKSAIRSATEEEEHTFYQYRALAELLQALAPLGTDAQKPFLETVPWLIAIFAESHSVNDTGDKRTHYYVR